MDRGTLIAAEQIVEIRAAEAERIRNLVPRTRLCIAVEGVSLHPKMRAGGKKAKLTKQASKAAAKGKAKAKVKAKKIAWEQKGGVGEQAKSETNGETKGETKEVDREDIVDDGEEAEEEDDTADGECYCRIHAGSLFLGRLNVDMAATRRHSRRRVKTKQTASNATADATTIDGAASIPEGATESPPPIELPRMVFELSSLAALASEPRSLHLRLEVYLGGAFAGEVRVPGLSLLPTGVPLGKGQSGTEERPAQWYSRQHRLVGALPPCEYEGTGKERRPRFLTVALGKDRDAKKLPSRCVLGEVRLATSLTACTTNRFEVNITEANEQRREKRREEAKRGW